MKVSYQFVCETVEVEVEEVWGEMLMDMDRREYNNHQSETRRHVSLDELNLDETLLPSDSNVEDEILKKEQMQALMQALNQLTPEQLEVLKNVYFEGKSVNSVAAELGVDQSAVSHRLRTIRKKLEKVLI